MKYLIVLLTFTMLWSCNEKVVQLPETHLKEITEILDVSPAYVFYSEEKDSVEFNRKNLISTTNWLVNVDKRLRLKQAFPHIIYLQNKRKKGGMHKNENAKNYFTCSNPNIKNLAFIDFTEVEYEFSDSEKNNDSTSNTLVLRFESQGNLTLNNSEISFDDLESAIINNESSKNISIYLNSNLTFQDYITLKSKLVEVESDSVTISNQEIIYN